MPTPFMHMALAHRLLRDPELPANCRSHLAEQWGAFLLGSIAPDARVTAGTQRGESHFFEYQPVVSPPPIIAMLSKFPTLRSNALTDEQHMAFVAGYAAHLKMDEVWCTDMLFPVFIQGNRWDSKQTEYLMLHLLLAWMDQRDLSVLHPQDYDRLAGTVPKKWLPFMSDEGLSIWRDMVAPQIAPGGVSLTNQILGQRVALSADEMANHINDAVAMQERMWSILLPEQLAVVEESMYMQTRDAVIDYLNGV
jgi:hypothetical protein